MKKAGHLCPLELGIFAPHWRSLKQFHPEWCNHVGVHTTDLVDSQKWTICSLLLTCTSQDTLPVSQAPLRGSDFPDIHLEQNIVEQVVHSQLVHLGKLDRGWRQGWYSCGEVHKHLILGSMWTSHTWKWNLINALQRNGLVILVKIRVRVRANYVSFSLEIKMPACKDSFGQIFVTKRRFEVNLCVLKK